MVNGLVWLTGMVWPRVQDLFHLINESNADQASQDVLAQTGQKPAGEGHGHCQVYIVIIINTDIFFVNITFHSHYHS